MNTDLARGIYDTCHLSGEFTLRSGRVANEHFDFPVRPGAVARCRESHGDPAP